MRLSSNTFEGNVLKYYVLELKKEKDWKLDVFDNDLSTFEVPKILEMEEKYNLINYTNSNNLILCHVEKNKKDNICLIRMKYDDPPVELANDNLLPIIDKRSLFGLSFIITEKFNIIDLKNTKLEDFIYQICDAVAKNKSYALYFDFKNLVELNGKIYIYRYDIYDLDLERENIIEKNINIYYPEEIKWNEKINKLI